MHKSVIAVTSLYIAYFLYSGVSNAFIWHKDSFYILSLPLSGIACVMLVKLNKADILSTRRDMLRACVLLDVIALSLTLVDVLTKLFIRADLLGTSSPYLMTKATDDHDLSLLASLVMLGMLARIAWLWTHTPQTQTTNADQKNPSEPLSNVLPTAQLQRLHWWHGAAACVGLLGAPAAFGPLITGAIWVGATQRPRVVDSKSGGDMFFVLAAGQKRLDTDY
eukprot:TRINITY_DN7346_c0_g1_i1.p1 TRINITY_DN7346_c0_g1~~TRINITY_DN7346_c0_g1_i1.p1  ORF type:complete len:222 (-),score=30.20 TRINITY_DN7346_c0_g1_i1:7-672(-)